MSVLKLLVLSSFALSVTPRWRRWPAAVPIIVLLAACAALLIEGPVSRVVATVVGVPSIVSVALLADLACRRAFARAFLSRRDRRSLLGILAILSAAVYPTTLGLVPGDAYRLGFSAAAPVAVAIAAIVFTVRREFGVAAVLGAALVALDLNGLSSLNAFDYLVDPFGGAVGIACAAGAIARRMRPPRPAVGGPVSL